jgi:hypothetical protein
MINVLHVKLEGKRAIVRTDEGQFTVNAYFTIAGPDLVTKTRQTNPVLFHNFGGDKSWQYIMPERQNRQYASKYWLPLPEELRPTLTAILDAALKVGTGKKASRSADSRVRSCIRKRQSQ